MLSTVRFDFMIVRRAAMPLAVGDAVGKDADGSSASSSVLPLLISFITPRTGVTSNRAAGGITPSLNYGRIHASELKSTRPF